MASDDQRQSSGFEDQLRQMMLNNGQPGFAQSSTTPFDQPTVRLPPYGAHGTPQHTHGGSPVRQQHGSAPSWHARHYSSPQTQFSPRPPPLDHQPMQHRGRGMQQRGYHAPHQRMQSQHQNLNEMSPLNSPGPQQRARYQQSMALDPNAFHRGGLGRPFRGRGGGPQQLFNPHQPLRSPVLSQPDRYARQVQYLEQVAAAEIRNVEMNPQEYEEKEQFRVTLEKMCHEVCAADPERLPSISLEPFGSFRSGFATAGSDMDLVIVVKGNVSTSACFSLLEDDLPRALERRLLQLGYGARLLTRTRVPIIKVCEIPGESFLDKLREERWKWDGLPNEKKYPHLYPQQEESEEWAPAEDPNAPIMVMNTSEKSTAPSYDHDSPAHGAVATNGTEATEPRNDTPKTRPETAPDAQTETNGTNSSQQTQGETTRHDKPWTRERKAGPLDFPNDGVGIQSDINFFNPLGLHNTQLLRCYSICDPRVRPMVLFVKAWAKKRKINSSYSGTLSSYGYVLMVLHYLVNVSNPPVLPNLQGQWVDKGTEVVVDGWSVHFRRDEEALATAAQQGQLTSNRESLGSLLNGFFQYFASVGIGGAANFRWMHEVLSLRSQGGLLTKTDKNWVKAVTEETEGRKVQHRYLFCIEDPFELDHNVARTVTHNGIVAIRDEFRRANRILFAIGNGNAPNDGELFADLVEVEDIWKATAELNIADGVKNGSVDGPQDAGVSKAGVIPIPALDQSAHFGNQRHANANLNQSSRGAKKGKQHSQPQPTGPLDVHDSEAFPTLGAAKPGKKKIPRPREDGEEFSEISGVKAKAYLEEVKRMKDEAQAESTAKGAAEAVLNGID